MEHNCPKCGIEVSDADLFCRNCGNSLQTQGIKWHHRRRVVLVLLFFVLGPLALRLLWSSPAFKTRERVLCTIASVLEILLIGVVMVRLYVSYMLNIAGLDQL